MSWMLWVIGGVLVLIGLSSGSLVYHRDMPGDDEDDGADWWKEDDSFPDGPKEFATTWRYRPAWVVLGAALLVAGFFA